MSLVQSDIDTMAKLKPYPMAMRGAPRQVIAEALGHADTRITMRTCLPSYVADTIRAELWPIP